MKNQFVVPSIIIAVAILGGFWMLKEPSESKTNTYVSIHEAVKKNDINAVKKLLASGTDVNARESGHGVTPLDSAMIAQDRRKLFGKADDGKDFTDMINLLRDNGGKTGTELILQKALRSAPY